MKIAIISASGRVGRLVLEEALKRGHEVTAIVRNPSKVQDLKPTHVIQKDIDNVTYDDVKDCDVIVDAFGVFDPEHLYMYSTTTKHMSDVLSNKPNRIIVVGGAGSLFTDASHKTRLFDSEGFPESYLPISTAAYKAFSELQQRNDVNWTYFSPAAEFDPNGKRTGKYKIGGDEVILNSEGKSYVSYADYAIAVVDECENNKFNKKRFTVVSG